MSGLRVLVVTNMYPRSANPYFGIFVERQVESLRDAGIELRVELIAAERGEADYLLAAPRLAAAIREFRPTVVHCHYGYTPLPVVLTGSPYIVTLCGDDLNGQSDGHDGLTLKSRVGVLVTQVLARGAQRVLVQSEGMRRALWSRSRHRAEVLPSGVDTAVFAPGSRAAARARLGLPADALVLGFVNSIRQPTKRLDIARAVCAELVRRGAPAQLLVAEAVPANEMPEYYLAADCLLMTSDREGAPNCVKEALACGTPVVGVPVGDLPELITEAGMGSVSRRDPSQLANAVQAIRRGPDIRPSLLPARFHADAVAGRLIEIYHAVAARG
jgi:teichuronic acid biosynthesis glycosyltransferase TuaC